MSVKDWLSVLWTVVLVSFFLWTMRSTRSSFSKDYERERPALKRQERIRFLFEIVDHSDDGVDYRIVHRAKAELRTLLSEELPDPDEARMPTERKLGFDR